MRKLRLLLALLAALSTMDASASSVCVTGDVVLVPFAYETITISSTALSLTSATYKPANCAAQGTCAVAAVIGVDTDAIRWTVDGVTTPTSTVGMPAASGGYLTDVCSQDISNFKAIRVTNDATIYVTYYRLPQ